MKRLLLTCALLALSLGAAAAAAEDVGEAIKQADRDFCQATIDHDRERFVSFLAEDAVFFGGGAPRVGKEAVATGWASIIAEGLPSLTWEPTTVFVFESGDLAHTIGTFELTTADGEGVPLKSTGQYMTIWRRQTDGTWKVQADIGTRPQPQ